MLRQVPSALGLAFILLFILLLWKRKVEKIRIILNTRCTTAENAIFLKNPRFQRKSQLWEHSSFCPNWLRLICQGFPSLLNKTILNVTKQPWGSRSDCHSPWTPWPEQSLSRKKIIVKKLSFLKSQQPCPWFPCPLHAQCQAGAIC